MTTTLPNGVTCNNTTWHSYNVTFTEKMAAAPAMKRAMALGRIFPTGWTEMKDGTVAAISRYPYTARGVKVQATGRTMGEPYVILNHVACGANGEG